MTLQLNKPCNAAEPSSGGCADPSEGFDKGDVLEVERYSRGIGLAVTFRWLIIGKGNRKGITGMALLPRTADRCKRFLERSFLKLKVRNRVGENSLGASYGAFCGLELRGRHSSE